MPILKKFAFHARYAVVRPGHPSFHVIKERECWVFHLRKDLAIEVLKEHSPNFSDIIANFPQRAACVELEMSQEEIIGRMDAETGSRTQIGVGAIMAFPPKEIEKWTADQHSEERLRLALQIGTGKI